MNLILHKLGQKNDKYVLRDAEELDFISGKISGSGLVAGEVEISSSSFKISMISSIFGSFEIILAEMSPGLAV